MNQLDIQIFDMIKEIAGDHGKSFNKESNLFDESILDSFGLIQLVSELDARFQISINTEDLTTQNFSSVATISKLVESYQKRK